MIWLFQRYSSLNILELAELKLQQSRAFIFKMISLMLDYKGALVRLYCESSWRAIQPFPKNLVTTL